MKLGDVVWVVVKPNGDVVVDHPKRSVYAFENEPSASVFVASGENVIPVRLLPIEDTDANKEPRDA